MGTAMRVWRGELDEERDDPPPPPRQPPLIETLDDLQRRAGNHAVSSLLAREPDQAGTGPGFSPVRPDLNLPPDAAGRREAEVLAKVTAYVERERGPLSQRIRQGVSIAEILDMVVRGIPEARELPLERLAAEVRRVFAPLVIRTHRDGLSHTGLRSEVEAQARLALPSLSGKPEIGEGPAGGYVRVGLSGVAAGVRRGSVQVEAESSWTANAKLMTKVGRVMFEAKLAPPTGDEAPEWEISLQFPGDEGLVPVLDSLPKVFSEAERGLRNAAAELQRRGDRGIGSAAAQMGAVKSAVEALSSLAAAPGGPRAGVKVEGQGPAVTIQATLTVSF